MRLAELRKEKKISQKELSLIFNVAQNTVSQWENGKRSLDTETLKKLADYFMVTTDYLLGLDYIKARPAHLKISEDDITLLQKIKNLSPDKREIVDTIIKVDTSNKK